MCLTSTKTIRLIRDGEKGVLRRGKREITYSYRYTVTSDESHFNVSVGSNGQSHKTVSTNHNLFEEKGEPKRYRTEVLTARPNRLACRSLLLVFLYKVSRPLPVALS